MANADGSNQTALTAMGPTAMGSPRWPPAGQTIAFDRYENGHSSIYSIGPQFFAQRQLDLLQLKPQRPSQDLEGPSGRRRAAATHARFRNEPFESPDGKVLYYVNGRGLWSLPLAGGDPKLVLPSLPMSAPSCTHQMDRQEGDIMLVENFK